MIKEWRQVVYVEGTGHVVGPAARPWLSKWRHAVDGKLHKVGTCESDLRNSITLLPYATFVP